MSFLSAFTRVGAAYRSTQTSRRAVLEMDGLPPELQRDIGWPASRRAQAGGPAQRSFWRTRG